MLVLSSSIREVFLIWEPEDNQIMSLMLTSIEPNIDYTLVNLLTAKTIWEDLEPMYSGYGNITWVF